MTETYSIIAGTTELMMTDITHSTSDLLIAGFVISVLLNIGFIGFVVIWCYLNKKSCQAGNSTGKDFDGFLFGV